MKTILQGIVGSSAYGLHHANSDTDRLAVHMRPTRDLLGLRGAAVGDESIVTTEGGDKTSHELSKVVNLLLKANPTALEILFLESYEIQTSAGAALVEIRKAFMSKRICATYGGYAKAQAERLVRRNGSFSSDTDRRKHKHGRHLARLMLQGTESLQTGVIRVRLDDDQIAICRAAEKMVDDPAELMAEFDRLNLLMLAAASTSPLPDEPNFEAANALLVSLRLSELHNASFV